MLSTTLTLLKEHGACAEGYKTLAKALGRGYGKDTPIPLARIVETNNLVDALWTMQAVPPEQAVDRDRIERLLACDYAEHVLHLFEAKHPTDLRPRQAIEVARRFAVGDATQEELAAAGAAAWALRGLLRGLRGLRRLLRGLRGMRVMLNASGRPHALWRP